MLTADGIAIGEINKLYFEDAHLTISSVEVRLRREPAERLGFSRSVFRRPTIEIPTGMVQSVGDAVLLAVPIDELRILRTSEKRETREPAVRTDKQPAHT